MSIKDDVARQSTPFGWGFRGRSERRLPSKKAILRAGFFIRITPRPARSGLLQQSVLKSLLGWASPARLPVEQVQVRLYKRPLSFGGIGAVPPLETYEGASAYRYANAEDAECGAKFIGQYLALCMQMGLGQRAVMASAVAGTRTKQGHNAADKHPTGHAPKHEKAKHVATDARTDAKKSAGPTHSATQTRRNRFTDLANKYVGVQGEHMSDYYCQNTKGWGNKSIHDQEQINTAKLNDGGKLVALWPVKARGRGIDGVWKSNGPKPYAIIEAKYSLDRTKSLTALLGEAWDKSEGSGGGSNGGQVANGRGSSRAGKRGSAKQIDPVRQSNGKVTQMSHGWVQKRLRIVSLTDPRATTDLRSDRQQAYSRHVLFFSIPQSVAHAEALLKHLSGQQVQSSTHAAHELTKEWIDNQIEQVVNNRAGVPESDRRRN